jgi:hypothetical protein
MPKLVFVSPEYPPEERLYLQGRKKSDETRAAQTDSGSSLPIKVNSVKQ